MGINAIISTMHKFFKSEEKSSFKGIITFKNYEIRSDRAREIDASLKDAHDMDPLRFDELMAELGSLCRVREVTKHNIVVLTGRQVFARILIGDMTYSGNINYGALGTDATAVNAADTVLGTEVSRKLFARRTRTSAAANFDFFYSQADTDGTYEEFGMFIDGSATVDTGQLFNHVLTGGWTKTNVEAMTVSVQVNVNQV